MRAGGEKQGEGAGWVVKRVGWAVKGHRGKVSCGEPKGYEGPAGGDVIPGVAKLEWAVEGVV